MFVGHFGAGFAAKKFEKRPSLGTLFMASQFIDLLWPLFLLLGIEKVVVDPGNSAVTPLNFIYYPFSHSLIAVIFWGILFAAVYFLIKKDFMSSAVLGLLVVSHWILDLITHIPDLPLTLWSETKVGLGLWNSLPLTLIVEGAIFFIGIFLYINTTRAINKKGNYLLGGFIIFLILVHSMNLLSAPPDNQMAIAVAGFSQWLLIAWGYWIDRNRTTDKLD